MKTLTPSEKMHRIKRRLCLDCGRPADPAKTRPQARLCTRCADTRIYGKPRLDALGNANKGRAKP